MSDLQIHTVQDLVKELFDHRVCAARELGVGATSTAWSVSCGSDQFVLRMTHAKTNRPITYRSEFVILQSLYNQGLPVPEPLYNSFDQPSDFDASISAWAITRSVAGRPISKNRLTSEVATQLGAFLKVLHELPCSNYGRLDEESTNLKGQQTSHIDGIRARWCWAQLWPFDNSSLSEHPIATIAPGLMNSVMAVETKLWSITTETNNVLTHSDLYGEHIFVADEMLSGVIDFGAAFISTPGWDFSVLAHYHGWEAVDVILKSYTQGVAQRHHLLTQSRYLAVAVGLYKLEKAVRARSEVTKQQQIIQFVAETLSLI